MGHYVSCVGMSADICFSLLLKKTFELKMILQVSFLTKYFFRNVKTDTVKFLDISSWICMKSVESKNYWLCEVWLVKEVFSGSD